MATVVRFGGNINWGHEEEKSLRRQRQRNERKERRKRMAQANAGRPRLVLETFLDSRFDNRVLEVLQAEDWAMPVFDSIMKKAQTNNEHHPTRHQQLAEFRSVWPRLTDQAKDSFGGRFDSLGGLFEKKFGLEDSGTSSEEEEKAREKARVKEAYSTPWFDVNETDDMRRSEVGEIVVDNLRDNFTNREQIFAGGAPGGGGAPAAAGNPEEADDEEESDKDAKEAATMKGDSDDGGGKKKASTKKKRGAKPQRESDEGDDDEKPSRYQTQAKKRVASKQQEGESHTKKKKPAPKKMNLRSKKK